MFRYVDVYPNNLDVELVLANTYLCIPESQQASPSHVGERDAVPKVTGQDGPGNAVVMHADVTLTQVWRGMPQVSEDWDDGYT